MPHWNRDLAPPFGYEFTDADDLRHVGTGLDDLVSKIAAYRARRGLPPGNPISEVNEQLCSKYPSRCLEGPGQAPSVTIGAPSQSAATQVTSWLRSKHLCAADRTLTYVGEEEVKRRAMICLKCPLQVSFPTGCVSCAETMNHISFQLRAGRDQLSSMLRMCGQFKTDLRVDTLITQPPSANAPENCWKR